MGNFCFPFGKPSGYSQPHPYIRPVDTTFEPIRPLFLRKCLDCNAVIEDKPSNYKYCSDCYSKRQRKVFCCKICKIETEGKYPKCYNCYQLELVTNTCVKCNEEFKVTRKDAYKEMCTRQKCMDFTSDQKKQIVKDLGKKKYSKKAIIWIQSIMEKEGIFIQHEESGGEIKVSTAKGPRKVDGFYKETNTVYEFHGNYFHGYPPSHEKYSGKGIGGKLNSELYEKTIARDRLLVDSGYKVVSIFEHEFV